MQTPTTNAGDRAHLEMLQAEADVKLQRSMPELEFALASRNHELVAAIAQDMMSKLAIIKVAADFFKRKEGDEDEAINSSKASGSCSNIATAAEHAR